MAGCGGGGGDGAAAQPPINNAAALVAVSQDVIGTYTMIDDTQDMTYVATGQRDYGTFNAASGWSGTLKVGATTWTQTLNINDGKGDFTNYGTYTFSSNSATTGSFVIRNMVGTSSKTGAYTITSNTDMTVAYDIERVSGWDVKSTYRWRKISNTP